MPKTPTLEEQLEERLASIERRVRFLEDTVRRSTEPIATSIDPEPLIVARKALGWTQEDVGRGIGVSRNTVHLWEKGRIPLRPWRAREIVRMFQENGHEPPAFEFPAAPPDPEELDG